MLIELQKGVQNAVEAAHVHAYTSRGLLHLRWLCVKRLDYH